MRTVLFFALLPLSIAALCAAEDPKPKNPARETPKAGSASRDALAATDAARLGAPNAAPGGRIPGAAPVDTKSYLIGAEDELLVSVWRTAEASGPVVVRPDGKISLPLIGEVAAAGLTPEQLTTSIHDRLTTYYQDPQVTVMVTKVNSKKYFIDGEINKPGAYPLIVPTTVLEGLVNGGGFRDFANTRKITILRGLEKLRFNYKEVSQGKHLEQNVFLQPGDHIIVK